MKKFLSILLSVILIISICPMGLFGITASAETGNITEFAGGSGTEDDPYLILNKVHLNNVRKYPTACFKLLVNIEYSGNETWQPIENFSGIFDGGNKSITNLKITEKVVKGENSYTGVFAINSGSIKNLNVFDADISNQTENNHNRYVYAGGITGKNTGTIENCSFSGTSYAYTKQIKNFWGFAYAGGICGVNSGTIIKCYNIGTIVSESSADNPKSCAGGITAYNTGIISFCYNTGNISSSLIASYDRTSSYYSDAHSGGIVGFMISQNAYINDCYNIGKIFTHVVSKSTNHIARSMAGGVYGRLASGTVSNCYAIKDIEVINKARTTKALNRYLETEVDESIYNELEKLLN